MGGCGEEKKKVIEKENGGEVERLREQIERMSEQTSKWLEEKEKIMRVRSKQADKLHEFLFEVSRQFDSFMDLNCSKCLNPCSDPIQLKPCEHVICRGCCKNKI